MTRTFYYRDRHGTRCPFSRSYVSRFAHVTDDENVIGRLAYFLWEYDRGVVGDEAGSFYRCEFQKSGSPLTERDLIVLGGVLWNMAPGYIIDKAPAFARVLRTGSLEDNGYEIAICFTNS